jgi:lysophospholipase L1-like esterase
LELSGRDAAITRRDPPPAGKAAVGVSSQIPLAVFPTLYQLLAFGPMNSISTSRVRFIKKSAMAVYLIISLPIVIVFFNSEYVRYINYQTVANWRSHFCRPTYAFCGDSITAGARSFDLKIGWIPFSGLNFGESGYTVLQVRGEVEKAIQKHCKYVFIMAGSNDVLLEHTALEQTVQDYDSLLALFAGSESVPIITLSPLTTDPKINDAIKLLDTRIRALAEKYHVRLIDLNPELAPDGLLLPIYTVDGVHLSGPAYKIWAAKMREVLQQ